eukprot:CAMPEP_0172175384 /NCGR_PEP_ID=MMETSP1050-20130122/14195_1 /TAXON_ID=233186 /ORGANISM="Cryptomonas curvata, Strain CCAP979/52" /LENGTH=47 /DNA_ID= /DNA_START= /DNA_END= /DNA_ORIENTATION=
MDSDGLGWRIRRDAGRDSLDWQATDGLGWRLEGVGGAAGTLNDSDSD